MQGGYPPGGPNNSYGPPPYGPPPGPAYGPPTPYGAPGPYPGAYPMHPGAPFGVHPTLGIPYSDKTKLAAGLLQIFVGFGVGRFYTGHTNIAVAQLVTTLICVFVLSWFTCGMSIMIMLWTFIDGIMLITGDTTDAQGRALR